MLLAMGVLVTALSPIGSNAQSILRGLIEEDGASTNIEDSVPPQRVGMPQFDMNLSENGTGSVTGYCFDEYLIAPRRTTRFENVLAGNTDAVVRTADGHSMSLKDAIAKGDVSVRALQLRVTFANNTPRPMTIRASRPVVLWDRHGGDVSQNALNVMASPSDDYDLNQKRVWRYTTAERVLAVLGYYEGSVWDIDRDRFQMAAASFQRDKGMAAGGQMNDETVNQLLSTDQELRSRLRSLGFRDQEGRSIHEDLAAQIRGYQRYLGMKPTGRWSQELASRLSSDEKFVPQIAALKVDGKTIGEVLADNGKIPDVLTYLKGEKGVMILMQTPEGVELWNRNGRSLKFEGKNDAALRKLDDAAARRVSMASKEDRVVIYPRAGNGEKVALMVGDRTVEVDGNELNRYLDGGELPKAMAAMLDPIVPSAGSEMTGRRNAPKLIVYRGPMAQGRTGIEPLRKAGLDQADGARLATALDRSYGDRAMVYLSDDLRLGAKQLRNEDMGALRTIRPSGASLALAR